MYKRTLIAIISLAAAGAAYAQMYKYVDENGVTVYTDRAHPGAESVALPSTTGQATTATRPAAVAPSRVKPAPEERPAGYQNLSIISPSAEETLWNIGGILNVTLALKPVLQQGHRLRVYYDGEPHTLTGTTLQISEVYRGTHSLQAEIVDQAGQLKIRSQTNQFYVQQTSIATQPRTRPTPVN